MHLRGLMFLLAGFFASGLVAGAQESRAADPVEKTIEVDGRTRHFLVHAPPDLKPGAATVVLLHGGTQSMRKVFGPNAGGTREWLPLAEEQGFVLLTPNAMNLSGREPDGDRQNWNAALAGSDSSRPNDVAFILAMLDWSTGAYATDPGKVLVTGSSNGGMMTYRLLLDAPERFAAGAAFIASLPADGSALRPPHRATPLLIYNGSKDPLIKPEGGVVREGQLATAPILAARDWWVGAMRADPAKAKVETLPDLDREDKCRIERTEYPALMGGARVQFLYAIGGGHAPPSILHDVPSGLAARALLGPSCKEAEGARLAWDFFADEVGLEKSTPAPPAANPGRKKRLQRSR